MRSTQDATARVVEEWRRAVLTAPSPAAGIALVQLGSWRRRRDSAGRLLALTPDDRADWLGEEIARVVFEASIRLRQAAGGSVAPIDFDAPRGYPSAEAAHWIRWAEVLDADARAMVAGWALAASERSPLRVRGQLAASLATVAEGPTRAACAAMMRAIGTEECQQDPEAEALLPASMALGAAAIEADDAAFDDALERLRPASTEWHLPKTTPVGEELALRAWNTVQTWAPEERAGVGLWIVPQLPPPARAGAADALAEALSRTPRLDLNYRALDQLAPLLGAAALDAVVTAFRREGHVDFLRTPHTLARLAALGRGADAMSLLGDAPDEKWRARLWAEAALAVLPHLPEGERGGLAEHILRLLDDAPEQWGAALSCLSDARLDEIETAALRREPTHAGLLLSALPAQRIPAFAERWLAGPLDPPVSAHAWMRIARRAPDLPPRSAVQVLWGLLDALSSMALPQVLDSVDEIDLSAAIPLLSALDGQAALARSAIYTKATLDRS